MGVFSSITFGAPWILLALAALPAIYFLLRVTPPSPRRVVFPPLRLLLGLQSVEETPARTPLWLLLLRLFAAALIIVALASPRIGTPPQAAGSGPLVLFVDNDWQAAHAWSAREDAIADALNSAAHSERAVVIVPTAGARKPDVSLLDAGAAERVARALKPEPYLPDRLRAIDTLAKVKFASRPEILWLSDDVDGGNAAKIADALSKIGSLKIFADARANGPLALTPALNQSDGFRITIIGNGAARDGHVEALGAHGERLGVAPFRFRPGETEAQAKITLPLEVRNETERIAIAGEDSAGAVRLLDSSSKRRLVGLVGSSNAENEQPLLSGLYYLERALSPYAELTKGSIADALDRHVSVLMLADVGRIAGEDYSRVEDFVKGGGVLVRFAGGRMTEATDDLIPVKLRSGGRYLGGSLAWAEPQHLAQFPDASPFRGLKIPGDVTISQQVLAEPSVELAGRIWARLADGTPLVTAEQRGKGWIVLFHVTAGPAWSNLPLSGLYIDMLRRILDLAGGARPADMGTDANAVFAPVTTLDGFGHPGKPPAEALPLRGSQIGKTKASPAHPPGFYGGEGALAAVNAADAGTALDPIALATVNYKGSTGFPLQPLLLACAIALILIDALISLWLRGYLERPRKWLAGASAVPLLLLMIHPAHADDSFDMQAALDTRLAYVITGVPDVDAMSKAGLTGLGLWLKARTSYEPEAPTGVDIAHDDLSFFPLIYWPMDPREKDLSPEAISKLDDYMRNGGTLLIDTRDLSVGATAGANSIGQQTLRRLAGKLDLPPLEPIPPDHVLTKAFYLLQDFPGRWDGGKVWVEALPPADPDHPQPARGGDGVSPVIIGGNDWAAAWAVDENGEPIAAVSDEQREMAIRFGINVVMYALTGNYKTDQVHVPALLQRLGK
ncbi:MAG TPA: DUF4159 domain-containing protein [Rhizomicrobium sp.]|nr:DUF4159 domain-containing protein [Rhizomicrobium sp.]